MLPNKWLNENTKKKNLKEINRYLEAKENAGEKITSRNIP